MVQYLYYGIDAVGDVAASIIRFIYVGFALNLYWTQFNTEVSTDYNYPWDLSMMIVLALAGIIYVYRFAYALIYFAEFVLNPEKPTGIGQIYLENVAEFVETNNVGYTFKFFQFWFYYVAGPMKISNLGDMLLLFSCAVSQNWNCIAFVALPIIPSLAVEYGLFTSQPQYDMPPFDWQNFIDYVQG